MLRFNERYGLFLVNGTADGIRNIPLDDELFDGELMRLKKILNAKEWGTLYLMIINYIKNVYLDIGSKMDLVERSVYAQIKKYNFPTLTRGQRPAMTRLKLYKYSKVVNSDMYKLLVKKLCLRDKILARIISEKNPENMVGILEQHDIRILMDSMMLLDTGGEYYTLGIMKNFFENTLHVDLGYVNGITSENIDVIF